MPTSHENALQQRCQQIVTSPVLSPEQKRHFLALEAENNLPYPQLPAEARRALDEGVICDMFEGHAPYKPRYVLPDYARFLANGSEWLELEGAKDLEMCIRDRLQGKRTRWQQSPFLLTASKPVPEEEESEKKE